MKGLRCLRLAAGAFAVSGTGRNSLPPAYRAGQPPDAARPHATDSAALSTASATSVTGTTVASFQGMNFEHSEWTAPGSAASTSR